MQDDNKIRKVVIMSLAGLLIGSLLFIFGISMMQSALPMILYYCIALLLYISSFLATYNNNKLIPTAVYKYIMTLSVFLMILITLVCVSRLI